MFNLKNDYTIILNKLNFDTRLVWHFARFITIKKTKLPLILIKNEIFCSFPSNMTFEKWFV